GAREGMRAALTTVVGTTLGNALLLAAIAVRLELGGQERRHVVRNLGLDRRGLSDLARHPGMAPRRRDRRREPAARARASLARLCGCAIEPENDRVFHGLLAAVRRSQLAG